MSAVDPAVRRQTLQAQRGSPRMLAVGMAGLLAIAAGAAALGAGSSALFSLLRTSVIDSVFDDRPDLLDTSPWLVTAGMAGGVLAVVGGRGVYDWAAGRYRGGEDPWLLAGPVGFAAFTVGFAAVVGSWLPAALALVTVVFAWAALSSTRALSALARERDRSLREGHRVPGSVHEVRPHTVSDDTGSRRVVGATVTVRYVDRLSHTRYVERSTGENHATWARAAWRFSTTRSAPMRSAPFSSRSRVRPYPATGSGRP